MKKVYLLHDKYTEEVIGSVLTRSPLIWELWEEWHEYNNSNSEEYPKISDFVQWTKDENKSNYIEEIEVDFIQL